MVSLSIHALRLQHPLLDPRSHQNLQRNDAVWYRFSGGSIDCQNLVAKQLETPSSQGVGSILAYQSQAKEIIKSQQYAFKALRAQILQID